MRAIRFRWKPAARVIFPLSIHASAESWTSKPPDRAKSTKTCGPISTGDEIKFVLCDAADYQWACQTIAEHSLDKRCPVLLSPVHGQLDPATLANWILRDRLPVRMQIQLHKLLWEDGPGR